ncbi:MAG: hypothetical protein DRJ13_01500 [Bacteroidetes bacterium]|nr:MAG: hypothetical protein DRJ13_01500 [Bacteroidota bacterium]
MRRFVKMLKLFKKMISECF